MSIRKFLLALLAFCLSITSVQAQEINHVLGGFGNLLKDLLLLVLGLVLAVLLGACLLYVRFRRRKRRREARQQAFHDSLYGPQRP